MIDSLHKYECIGYSLYSNFTPSFSEPIFYNNECDKFYIQILNEIDNKIDSFVEISHEDYDITTLNTGIEANIGDNGIFCLSISNSNCSIGNIYDIEMSLKSMLEQNCPLGLRIQILDILNIQEGKIASKCLLENLIQNTSKRSALSYYLSLARITLWKNLAGSALNEDIKLEFNAKRKLAEVKLDDNGKLFVDLSQFKASDYPTLDFNEIANIIEYSIGKVSENLNDNKIIKDQTINDDIQISHKELKKFLDEILGPDKRIQKSSYKGAVKNLIQLGFRDLLEVKLCIEKYNGRQLAYIAYQTNQGQITKFELMLLASMGEAYLENSYWNTNKWYTRHLSQILEKFRSMNVAT